LRDTKTIAWVDNREIFDVLGFVRRPTPDKRPPIAPAMWHCERRVAERLVDESDGIPAYWPMSSSRARSGGGHSRDEPVEGADDVFKQQSMPEFADLPDLLGDEQTRMTAPGPSRCAVSDGTPRG